MQYWDGRIPEFCKNTCEVIWEGAHRDGEVFVDAFSRTCDPDIDGSGPERLHEVQNGGEDLQRLDADRRSHAYLNICAYNQAELSSEIVTFHCPNN